MRNRWITRAVNGGCNSMYPILQEEKCINEKNIWIDTDTNSTDHLTDIPHVFEHYRSSKDRNNQVNMAMSMTISFHPDDYDRIILLLDELIERRERRSNERS